MSGTHLPFTKTLQTGHITKVLDFWFADRLDYTIYSVLARALCSFCHGCQQRVPQFYAKEVCARVEVNVMSW